MTMNPKHALSLFVTLAVALAVASAMAQVPARDPIVLPDSLSLPTDDSRSRGETSKSADFRPSRDTVYWHSDLIKTNDPFSRQIGGEEAELVSQTNALIRQLEAADSGSQREDVKAKLSEFLGKQFDTRQKRYEREIKALEAQIKKLKELVQKRQENRAEIIARRLDQIVRESQGLGF
jgi:hypothetical protein